MIPVRYDFKFWSNSDYSEAITMSVDGVPFDFTGHTLAAQFRRSKGDASVIFSLVTVVTETEGFYIVDNGFEIRVDKETLFDAYGAIVTNATLGQTVAMVADIVVTTPTGVVETWFDCTCELNYGVTSMYGVHIPSRVVSVADFGATPDSTDSSAQVQAAIDSLPVTGGTVFVPFICNVQNIYLNGTARDKQNVILLGAGWGTGLKLIDGAGAVNLIDGDGAVGCRVENMTLDGNRTNQTIPVLVDGPDYENYNGVYLEAASDCAVMNNKIVNMAVLGVCVGAPHVAKTGADRCRVEGNYFNNNTVSVTGMRQRFSTITGNTVKNGAGSEDYHLLIDEYSTDCLVSNNVVDGDSLASGIYCFRASDNSIIGNKIANCLVSILLSDASNDNLISGNTCRNAGNSHIKQINGCLRNKIAGNTLDTAAQYCIVSEAGTGGSTHLTITDNYCRGAAYSNIGVFATTVSRLVGNYCWEANGSGIYVSGACDYSEMTDNYCYNNALTSAADAGIRLVGQNNVVVENNKCFDNQGTKTQVWGIRGNETAPGTVLYIGNDVRFNLTAGMALSGTPVVKENQGFVTEAYGQTALPAATTSLTINHGLEMTPDIKSVRVGLYDATVRLTKALYVANVGATTFEVRADVAPGADTVITWEAKSFV